MESALRCSPLLSSETTSVLDVGVTNVSSSSSRLSSSSLKYVNLQASCQFCSERDAHKQALFPGQPPRVRHGLLGATMTVLTVDDHGVQDFRYEPCPTPWILCLRGTPPEITGLSASPTHMILTPSSSLEFDAFFDLAKPGLT